MNRVRLQARLVERSAVRYTPAGVAVTEARFRHEGALIEAGAERQVQFEFHAIGIGGVAQTLGALALGAMVEIDGFLATASKRSQRLRVHITDYREISGV